MRVAVVGDSADGYLTLMSGFVIEPQQQAIISFFGFGDIYCESQTKPNPPYRPKLPIVPRNWLTRPSPKTRTAGVTSLFVRAERTMAERNRRATATRTTMSRA